MDKFKISFIIPVYNIEEYLDEAVLSIIDQTMDFKNNIEIILINDGSKDNSGNICLKYKDMYPDNILYIDKKNAGVSAARNDGLAKASGKYIMFLDGDDAISKNTCSRLYKFFEKHYDETDVVVYPRYNYNNKTKRKTLIGRFRKFKGSGVYDLNKDYQLVNPTLNVITKNLLSSNFLFDTNLSFHEDEKYMVKILSQKKKMGYVDNCKYYYRIHPGSTMALKGGPYYCFEQYIGLYESLIEEYRKTHVPKFVQANIFNDIKWRINAKQLFLEGDNPSLINKATKRIEKIMDKIDAEVILNDQTLSIYYKQFYIERFKKEQFKPQFDRDNIYKLFYKDDMIFYNNHIELVLCKFKYRHNKLCILGLLKSPILNYYVPKLSLKLNKKIIDIEVKNRCLTVLEKEDIGINGYSFDVEIDLDDITRIEFQVKINNKTFPVSISSVSNVSFNPIYKIFTYIANDKVFILDKDKNINIRKYTDSLKKKTISLEALKAKKISNDIIKVSKLWFLNKLYYRIINNLKFLRKNYRVFLYRLLGSFKQNIWLYIDRGHELGISYNQFVHDISICDKAIKYYVTSKRGYDKIKKTKPNLIDKIIIKGSFNHKVKFLKSKKIISSHIRNKEYLPFPKSMAYYNDLVSYDLYYIQDGILKQNYTMNLNKEKNEVYKYIVSNTDEKRLLIDRYNYTDSDIVVCQDNVEMLDKEVDAKNKILFAPSYREFLIKDFDDQSLNDSLINNSVYYNKIVSLLTNKQLMKILTKNNLVFEFKLHSNLYKMYNYFKQYINDYIKIIIDDVNLSDYKMLITDFSSIQYNYLKYRRPIYYYIFDNNELNSRFHIFNSFDYRQEIMFGKCTFESDELIKIIEDNIKNDFKVSPNYLKRMNGYNYNTNKNYDKIYDCIMDKE